MKKVLVVVLIFSSVLLFLACKQEPKQYRLTLIFEYTTTTVDFFEDESLPITEADAFDKQLHADKGYTYAGWLDTNGRRWTSSDRMPGYDLTLTQTWVRSQYSVNFRTNGGSGIDEQSIEYGKTVSRPSNPSREGYTFEGWYSDEACTMQYDFKTEIKANTVIYANWLRNYTVSFETNGGTSIKQQTVISGNTAYYPGSPTKEGYRFDGWFTNDSITSVYNFSSPVTQDITLYAGWTRIWTVIFDSTGGSSVSSQKVVSGNYVLKPSNPSREGYAFNGWYEDSDFNTAYNFSTSVKNNITLYAGWIKTYSITFDSNGGSSVSSQTIKTGKTASKPKNPSRTGYVFDGWYSDVELTEAFDFTTVIADDMTIFAGWTKVHTVCFETNGGSTVQSQSVVNGNTAVVPANPELPGYSFAGWYSDEACTKEYNFLNEVKSDLAIYAKWLQVYTVQFLSNGGTEIGSQAIIDGNCVSEPSSPSRSGYLFGGWYTESELTNCYSFSTPVSSNIILYAKWTPINYTVVFNGNKPESTTSDLDGSMENQVFIYDSVQKLNANNYSIYGYSFAGWTTIPDGSGVVYSDEELVSNLSASNDSSINLYAKWICSLKIGDRGPAGGYIIYVDTNNSYADWDYLEAAPSDISIVVDEEVNNSFVFGSKNFLSGGARESVRFHFYLDTNVGIGYGITNTEKLYQGIGSGTSQTPYGELNPYYAAKLALNYSVVANGVEYDDWFLPSKAELNAMYNSLKTANLGDLQDGYYWSSSQNTSYLGRMDGIDFNMLIENNIWVQDFSNGNQSTKSAYAQSLIRCVRAF